MTAGANLVIGLDVGTTAVRTVVAELDRETRSLRVIGLGHAAARGLRKGLVTNLDGAVESITRSVEDAEKMANVEIHSVFAGITGGTSGRSTAAASRRSARGR